MGSSEGFQLQSRWAPDDVSVSATKELIGWKRVLWLESASSAAVSSWNVLDFIPMQAAPPRELFHVGAKHN